MTGRRAAGRVLVAVAVAVTSVLTACGGAGGGPGGEALVVVDGIAVLDAWARPTPPGADEAAIYVTLENRAAGDTAVLGASSSRCAVMLPHTTTFADDIASMGEALDADLRLADGERVVMEPNGLHLMCLGLAEPLVTGEGLDVTVELVDHEPIDVVVSVEQR